MDLLCAQFVTTFSSSSLKDILTILGSHSDSKTVGFTSFAVIGLERAFHRAAFTDVLGGCIVPLDSGQVCLFQLRLGLLKVFLHLFNGLWTVIQQRFQYVWVT